MVLYPKMTHLFLWPLSHVFTACRHFHDDTSWKSLKKHLNWRTYILSSITPFDLISTLLERYFSWIKNFRRHQSLKMPRNTLKMIFFDVYASFLNETRVCTRVAIYNTCIHLKYVNFYITTWIHLLCTWLLSLQPMYAS